VLREMTYLIVKRTARLKHPDTGKKNEIKEI
jgi:hypothetical protein